MAIPAVERRAETTNTSDVSKDRSIIIIQGKSASPFANPNQAKTSEYPDFDEDISRNKDGEDKFRGIMFATFEMMSVDPLR